MEDSISRTICWITRSSGSVDRAASDIRTAPSIAATIVVASDSVSEGSTPSFYQSVYRQPVFAERLDEGVCP